MMLINMSGLNRMLLYVMGEEGALRYATVQADSRSSAPRKKRSLGP